MVSSKLEKYRIFPYLAWITIILFACFVFNLAQTLQQTSNHLNNQKLILEATVNQDVMEIQFAPSTRPKAINQ